MVLANRQTCRSLTSKGWMYWMVGMLLPLILISTYRILSQHK